MPDDVKGTNNPNANVLNQMPGRVDMDEETKNLGNPEIAYLKSIDSTLRDMAKNGIKTSQSAAKQYMPRRTDFRDVQDSKTESDMSSFGKTKRKNSGGKDPAGDFLDGIEKSLMDSLGGSDLKKRMKGLLKNVSDTFGAPLEDIPGMVGEELGKQAMSAFKGTALGKSLTGRISNYANNIMGDLEKAFPPIKKDKDTSYGDSWGSSFGRKHGAVQDVKHAADKSLSEAEANYDLTDAVFNIQCATINIASPRVQEDQMKQEAYNAIQEASQQSDKGQSQLQDNTVDEAKDQLKDKAIDKAQDFIEDKLPGGDKMGEVGDFLNKGKEALSGVGRDLLSGSKSGGVEGAVQTGGKALSGFLGSMGTTPATGTVAAGTAASTGMAAGMADLTTALGSVVPPLLALAAAMAVLQNLMEAFAPLIEGISALFGAMNKAGNRYNETREKMIKHSKERLEEDIETVVKKPFEIMEQSAQKIYDAWDNTMRKINATQGYSKSDLQDLMGAFATRLREEGLTEVVSGADLVTNLGQVLDSGLSGQVAEEFAYMATKLNAAIPTQDFFNYASTYASLAANAIKNGQSEAQAIAYANSQLELFASNVLYSSRVLTSGFTTGLQDAQSLFEESVKIAQTSRTGDPAQIAGVLTAVSAATGAIAPDLANALTGAVVQAATGGNSSQLVALRSLAGVNASNTQFLQQLAKDPQGLFVELFRNLANMQTMSEDAYMEVAEGLSDIFGLSMDTFARVDFNYLADAIANMNVNDAALLENMELLQSGETTTSAEQMRMAQINKYMIEEGLAYVLDNEAARVIQQHMWDEQMKNELVESTYGVEIKGAALDFLEGIRKTVDNIINLLNPFAWIGKLVNGVTAAKEEAAMEADFRQLLELGKVGTGNAQSLYQLTTRGVDLNVAPSLINMMGGTSLYQIANSNAKALSTMPLFSSSPTGTLQQFQNAYSNLLVGALNEQINSNRNFGVSSRYSWGSVGKSITSLLGSLTGGSSVGAVETHTTSGTEASQSDLKAKIDKMLEEEYMQGIMENEGNYEDWAASGKKYGISDMSKALKEIGYSEEDVKARFQSKQVQEGARIEQERREREDLYWDNTEQYQLELKDNSYILVDNTQILIDLMEYNNTALDLIYAKHSDFYDAWVDYYVNHTVYNEAFGSAKNAVTDIRNQERDKSDSAVYALAEALNKNSVDLLKDPVLQTNAILAQILIVVNAIMQQNNQTGGVMSLPDTLQALSMGLMGGTGTAGSL